MIWLKTSPNFIPWFLLAWHAYGPRRPLQRPAMFRDGNLETLGVEIGYTMVFLPRTICPFSLGQWWETTAVWKKNHFLTTIWRIDRNPITSSWQLYETFHCLPVGVSGQPFPSILESQHEGDEWRLVLGGRQCSVSPTVFGEIMALEAGTETDHDPARIH